jgi:histidinol-phosphatase
VTPPAVDADLLSWAVELTKEAGRRTLARFRCDDLAVEAKGDGTPVTEADKDAEAYIRAELATAHPHDAVLGEEEGDQAGTTGRRWIIDPIDGTKAFMRGVPLYSNLLAVEDEHGWAIGVINLPGANECVFAGRGLGAFQDDCHGERRPARVGPRSGKPFLTASGFTRWDDATLLRVKQAGWALRTWGDGFGYAMVATGRADAMVDPTAALWDIAPMPVIMAEAGGRFSTWSGSPDPREGSGVATNGEGHDELLALLRGS